MLGTFTECRLKSGELMNWAELLKPENGGPGESPGRDEAVQHALEVTAERKRIKAELQALKAKKKRGRG